MNLPFRGRKRKKYDIADFQGHFEGWVWRCGDQAPMIPGGEKTITVVCLDYKDKMMNGHCIAGNPCSCLVAFNYCFSRTQNSKYGYFISPEFYTLETLESFPNDFYDR